MAKATMSVQVPIETDSAGCLIVPTGSVVKGLLDLTDRQDIKFLPEGLHAEAVDLSGSAVRELPQGMRVEGWLDIQNTAISIDRLPEDLQVGAVIFYRDEKGTPISWSQRHVR